MEYTWNRAFADGRDVLLMGGNAEKLLDASRRLSLEGNPSVSCFVEAPLLGEPDYDSLVIHNPRFSFPGCRISDLSLLQAQAAVDWAAGLGRAKPYLHFELDSSGCGSLSGIHCRMEGSLEWAEGFFRAMGQPERTAAFVRKVQNLPEGWFCRYTGVFPGRKTNNTRMEVKMLDQGTRRALCDPKYLRQCFDQIGFTAFNDRMLLDIARLAEVEASISIQFDMLPDGSFLPVLSFLSLYEKIRPDCSPLFAPGGWLKRTCGIYEDMGISDDRWQVLEKCFFTERKTYLTREGLEGRAYHCFPCCTKAKWIGGERTPAKFYLLLESRRIF